MKRVPAIAKQPAGRRIRLVRRRLLFLLLCMPVVLMYYFSGIIALLAEVVWVVYNYLSGKEHHEWLQWTTLLTEGTDDLIQWLKSLNSLPSEPQLE